MAPTTVGPVTISALGIEDSVSLPYQRKTFYANGRHWVFFVSGDQMAFSSSLDGTTWTALTNIRAVEEGAEFSTWLQDDGVTRYVHYAYSDAVGGGALYYRRGLLNADGTITWTAEQIAEPADAGYEYESLGITLDNSGFVYICYVKVEIADPNNRVPMVTQSIVVPYWVTSAGYPYTLTAVQDASWIVIIIPFGIEVMTIYATDGGNIVYRVLSAAIWGAQTDSGFDIISAIRMSATTEYYGGGVPVDAHLVFQDTSEDIIHASYTLAGWSAGHTILAAADPLAPMLSVLWYGNEDGVNFRPSQQLYCFWLPLTADPTANYVTYKVSRDEGVTWTNEAGGAGSTSWLDETGGPPEGFPNVQVGSVAYRSSLDAEGNQHLGVVYTNRGASPENVRFGELEFDEPDEDLACGFVVRQPASANLAGELIIRHNSDGDTEGQLLAGFEIAVYSANQELGAAFEVGQGSADLLGELVVRQGPDNENLPAGLYVGVDASGELLGELIVRQLTSQDLAGELIVRQGPVNQELLGALVVRHPDSENLLGEFVIRRSTSRNVAAGFNISHDPWITQGVNVAVYQALGIIT